MSAPEQVVDDFIAAIERKDIDAAGTYVHDDIRYENVPIDPILGRDAMKATLGMFLGNAGDVDWVVNRQVVDGNLVANERLDRFQIGDGWLELPVAGFFDVDDDGLITVWRDYFDMNSYTSQLAALTGG